MNAAMPAASSPEREGAQVARYIVNGLVATAVHYGVLSACIELLHVPSAAVANVIAAAFGITTSFLGSRYFVFRRPDQPMLAQASRFGVLYAAIAVLHGAVLGVWTDWWRLDYRWGFVIATGLQVVCSYWGNKHLVFAPKEDSEGSRA